MHAIIRTAEEIEENEEKKEKQKGKRKMSIVYMIITTGSDYSQAFYVYRQKLQILIKFVYLSSIVNMINILSDEISI